MLEAWKNGKTNPADPVDDKFTPENQEKLDRLNNLKDVAPNMPASSVEQSSSEDVDKGQSSKSQEPKALAANFNVPSTGAAVSV